ncbi:cytochrome P450 [Streptomyces tendae]|uniref:cytochrome P450 n=1 Tax=Streptomyces tendae TaxID=1932 RepID=UPI00370F7BA3
MSEAVSYEDAWARIDKFDPPAIFDELRKGRPPARMVYPDGHVGWIATSHELVRQVLGDPRFSHDMQIGHCPVTIGGSPIPQFPAEPGVFIHMDPPDQARYRRLLTKEFTVRGVSQLAPAVEAVAAEQIAEMPAQGNTADFLETFAQPLILKVLAPLTGLDYSQRDRFAEAPAVTHDPSIDLQTLMDTMQHVVEFVHETLARKKSTPGDDIISRLIKTGELSDQELTNFTLLLLFAGYETTEGALATGTFALLHHTEQLAALRGDLTKIDDAVEEILRYVTVNQYMIFRTAPEDVELGGESVRKGETVTVSLPAANRDPAKFDCPAQLDLDPSSAGHPFVKINRTCSTGVKQSRTPGHRTVPGFRSAPVGPGRRSWFRQSRTSDLRSPGLDRDTTGHVAFGYGVHQCMGQNLARLVLRIGLRSLLDAFPDLRLAVPADEIPLRTKQNVFSVKSLPVSWQPLLPHAATATGSHRSGCSRRPNTRQARKPTGIRSS